MYKIGILTVGQSPRSDVVPDMAATMGVAPDAILEMGALDGLGPEEIDAMRPATGEFHLITRLGDGSEVIIAKERILPRMAQAVKELEGRGADMILLLCNGAFPRFESGCLVIEPNKLVDRTLAGLMDGNKRLGVVLPVAEQTDWALANLRQITPNITICVASPYADGEKLDLACRILENACCDLVVLYCMGFNRRLGDKVRARVSMPVMVSSSLVARIIGELAGGG